MGADRRTTGIYLEDSRIEAKSAREISVRFKDTAHISVTSFNRHVLLTGEVASESDKAEVAQIVSSIQNVSGVSNELVVGKLSSLGSRSNDALITSNVKLRFLNNKTFQPDHVKVVAEDGTVFLMGMVKRMEAEAATDIASNSKGVQQVVTVFEYLD